MLWTRALQNVIKFWIRWNFVSGTDACWSQGYIQVAMLYYWLYVVGCSLTQLTMLILTILLPREQGKRPPNTYDFSTLTHWGRATHICVSNLTIIGSDNGLSPERRQAIIWTNAGILLTGPLGTNFSEILIAIETFSFKKMHLKISSAKWRPFCLGLNVLRIPLRVTGVISLRLLSMVSTLHVYSKSQGMLARSTFDRV